MNAAIAAQPLSSTTSKLPPPKLPPHPRQQQPFPLFASSFSTKPGATARPGLALAPGEECPFMLWPPNNALRAKAPQGLLLLVHATRMIPFHPRPSNRTTSIDRSFISCARMHCIVSVPASSWSPLDGIASGAAIYGNVASTMFITTFLQWPFGGCSPSTSLPNFTCISLAWCLTPGHLLPRPYIPQTAPAAVCDLTITKNFGSLPLPFFWLKVLG